LIVLILGAFAPSFSFAQTPVVVGKDVEVKEVGRGSAAKYFEKSDTSSSTKHGTGENVLYIMAGPYINSASYAWKGSDKRTGIAKNSYSFTYLFEQWHNIDTNIRGDFTDFAIDDERLLKFSILPLWTFPLVETRFPLYFGLGAGLGIFFKQVDQESNLSFDYQLVVGTRFLDLLGNAGAVIEFGMKNHVHLLSDGQLNATALTVGTVFSF
jgi:hypothetical protein